MAFAGPITSYFSVEWDFKMIFLIRAIFFFEKSHLFCEIVARQFVQTNKDHKTVNLEFLERHELSE